MIYISTDIDYLTVDDIQTVQHDIAYINSVAHRCSFDSSFKGKPLFLKFCMKGHDQDTVYLLTLTKVAQQLNFKKKTFNQAMKGKPKYLQQTVYFNYYDWYRTTICLSLRVKVSNFVNHQQNLLFKVESSAKPINKTHIIQGCLQLTLYSQPFQNRILTYSLTAEDCKSSYTTGLQFSNLEFEFIPLQRKFVLLYNGY